MTFQEEILNRKPKGWLVKKVVELENEKDSLEQDIDYWMDEAGNFSERIDELESKLDEINPQKFIDWLSMAKPNLANQELVDAINSFCFGKIERVYLYK